MDDQEQQERLQQKADEVGRKAGLVLTLDNPTNRGIWTTWRVMVGDEELYRGYPDRVVRMLEFTKRILDLSLIYAGDEEDADGTADQRQG